MKSTQRYSKCDGEAAGLRGRWLASIALCVHALARTGLGWLRCLRAASAKFNSTTARKAFSRTKVTQSVKVVTNWVVCAAVRAHRQTDLSHRHPTHHRIEHRLCS